MSPEPQAISHHAEVRRITWIGLVVNILLCLVKFALGLLGASQALIADAVHSLSDTATDIAVLLGVKFWSAPADEEHPYGHWRLEALITVFIALVLIGAAIGLGYSSLASLRDPLDAHPGWAAFAGALISIASKEALYRWTIGVGRRVRSSAVIANAWHHRSDALSSVTVALALMVALIFPDLGYVDHVAAIVVALFILHAAYTIVRTALGDLLDRGAPLSDRDRIAELAQATEGVDGVHAIRTRRVGPGFYVDLHITVDGDLSVRHGHEIAGCVKHRLLDEGPDVLDVIVHLEPTEPPLRE